MVVCEHKTLACNLTDNNRRDNSKSLIEDIDKTKASEEVVLVSLSRKLTIFSLSFTICHLNNYGTKCAVLCDLRIFLIKACH